MAEKTVIRGLAFPLLSRDERLIDNIDTDMIFHNKWLHITEKSQMGKYALGNLEGYEDFPRRVSEMDLSGLDGFFLIAGRNFGAGSSRQQAVDCFKALNCCGIIAESVAPIYLRNAINSALPICQVPSLSGKIRHGNVLELNLHQGFILNCETGERLVPSPPISPIQIQILRAGGLLKIRL